MVDRTDVIILGAGPCARQVANNLDLLGVTVSLVFADNAEISDHGNRWLADRIQQHAQCRLLNCSGYAGNFRLRVQQDGRLRLKEARAIVIAEDQLELPNFERYGVQETDRIWPLARLESALARHETPMFSDNEKATVVFLNGWHLQSHPAVAARMLQHCLSLQKQGAQTFFLTGNLKVAGKGLEDLYQQAKCHGAIFLKFDQDFPHVHQLPDGRAQFDCPDDAADMRLQITADWTIVDETHQPAAVLKPLGSWLAIERDPFGFLQADNVHRLVNFTNRRGIFAAGASRDWMSEASKLADAQHVALSVADFLQDHDRMDTPCAQIEQGKCARCLTCVRLCPYQAIAIESHITIKTEACQGCGICAAGCPARAIAMDRMDVDTSLVRATAASTPEPAENLEMPRLAVFCCSRSASAARRTAAEQGRQLKSDVFFIEGMCAGSFSARHLLYAFEAGMDGVMVLTCHENNCHSGSGRYRAELNVATAHKLLEPAGIESERLVFHSLAANMPAQLATVIGDFTQRIRSLSAVAHQLPGRPETG